MAAGASLNGHLSTVFFKSVGLNVALDSLIQLPLMDMPGGMVVILGDDPGANSSQNEQDNRWFSRMSYMPMLEPSTPQEAYDMYREAVRLSVAHKAPVALRLTTHVCHARQVVSVQGFDGAAPDWTPRFDSAHKQVPIAKTVFPMKARALAKLDTFEGLADELSVNAVTSPGGRGQVDGKRLGLISSGLPAMCLTENLTEAEAPVDLLKLGMTYPLPKGLLTRFLKEHDQVLIVEELDRVLEGEIKALAWEEKLECEILVRQGHDELMGELGPRRTWDLLSRAWPGSFPARDALGSADHVTPRLPQMCPGCGHRSAFHAVRQALGSEDITVADIGCHSLGFMPPYEMGEVLFSMGHGVSTASGIAINNKTRKVVTFIGDSTFFHAGMPGIVNSALRDHNITLVVMENGTTAMTGHQPRHGSGEIGDKIPIATLLEAMGVKFIRNVDAYNQAELTGHLKDAMAHEGFAVVIARHPCMLKFTRESRRRNPGFKLPPVKIENDVCERLHTCVAEFGCPSFIRHEDGSVSINEELCIGDGSCLQTCSVNAIVRQKPGVKK